MTTHRTSSGDSPLCHFSYSDLCCRPPIATSFRTSLKPVRISHDFFKTCFQENDDSCKDRKAPALSSCAPLVTFSHDILSRSPLATFFHGLFARFCSDLLARPHCTTSSIRSPLLTSFLDFLSRPALATSWRSSSHNMSQDLIRLVLEPKRLGLFFYIYTPLSRACSNCFHFFFFYFSWKARTCSCSRPGGQRATVLNIYVYFDFSSDQTNGFHHLCCLGANSST